LRRPWSASTPRDTDAGITGIGTIHWQAPTWRDGCILLLALLEIAPDDRLVVCDEVDRIVIVVGGGFRIVGVVGGGFGVAGLVSVAVLILLFLGLLARALARLPRINNNQRRVSMRFMRCCAVVKSVQI
jgi:hypothetical protein